VEINWYPIEWTLIKKCFYGYLFYILDLELGGEYEKGTIQENQINEQIHRSTEPFLQPSKEF
jgi:hypothetical protein